MRARVAEILSNEIWLANRLRQHGAAIFDGVTDPEARRERVRAAILAHGLAQVIVGRGQDRKPRTYAEVFEAIYGEPLAGAKAKTSRVASPEPAQEPISTVPATTLAAPKNSSPPAPSRLTQSSARPAQLSLGDSHP